jgi:hypothetical protein
MAFTHLALDDELAYDIFRKDAGLVNEYPGISPL